MKALSLLFLVFFCTMAKKTDECSSFYYFKDNTEVTFLKYNGKGEKTGKEVAFIEAASTDKNGSKSRYKVTKLDGDDKVKEISYATISCTNEWLKIGFQIPNEIAENQNEAYYLYPSDMRIGQNLEGSLNFAVKTTINTKKTNLSFSVKDRKVVGIEKVKVPYGTFDCVKIQYNLTVKFKLIGISIPMNLKIIEWFSPGFGIVKTESYNKDGKLEELSVLTTITRVKK